MNIKLSATMGFINQIRIIFFKPLLLVCASMLFTHMVHANQPIFTDVGDQILVLPMMNDGQLPDVQGGATSGDFDGDGDIDIIISTSNYRELFYRNNGDGTFSEIGLEVGFTVVTSGAGLASGDIDNDGDLDVLMSVWYGPGHYLYINDGHGVFSEQAVLRNFNVGNGNRSGRGIALGDYDNDGYLDVFIAEWITPWSNLDGAGPIGRLLHNLGATQPGYFEDQTVTAGVVQDNVQGRREGTFGMTPRFTDLDGDTWADLVITSDFDESRLYWNNGDGSFTEGTVAAGFGTGSSDMGMDTNDFNGDGLLDIVTTAIFFDEDGDGIADNHHDGNRLFLNNGDRTFSDVTSTSGIRNGHWGWGVVSLDYDNDGDLDLIQTNGMYPGPCQDCSGEFPTGSDLDSLFGNDKTLLFENQGNVVFTEKATELGLINDDLSVSLIAFDYDQDGDLDILHMNVNAQPNLFRNDSNNTNAWLNVKLVPDVSPPNGIGALIIVTPEAGGPGITREVSGSGTYMAQDGSGIVHFGLGNLVDGALVEVTIKWPGGNQQTQTAQAVNQTITYYEATDVSIVADKPSPLAIDTVGTVTFAATAVGGSGSYEYQFWMEDPSGNWFLVQDYGSLDTYGGIPDTVGTYRALVRVRNVGSSADFDAQSVLTFVVLGQAKVRAVSIVADMASPAMISSGPVTFIAEAFGGGIAEYMFLLQTPEGIWTIAQDYGNANSFTTSFPTPGTYSVIVYARNSGSTADYEALGSINFELLDEPALGTVILTADKNSPATFETVGVVMFTAEANLPGSGNQEYQFFIRDPEGTWFPVQNYSQASTYSGTPEIPGSYLILARVRNVGSTADYEAQVTMDFQVLEYVLISAVGVSFDTLSPAMLNALGPVTFSAEPVGGSGNNEYQFWLQAPDGTSSLVRPYSRVDTVEISFPLAGVYTIFVAARNTGNEADYEVIGSTIFEVTDDPVVTLSADKSSPTDFLSVGTVTFTATLTGGSETYVYQFWIQNPTGTWLMVQNYSEIKTYAETPESPGTYLILARVRATGSNADFDAQTTMQFIVTEPDNLPLVVNNGTGSGSYNPGDTVVINADAPVKGYFFSHWASTAGGTFDDAFSDSTNFVMPAVAATVSANYIPGVAPADNVSVARRWNEVLMQAIRNDFARPTVHARNLFHISSAMYDAWAAYALIEDTWLLDHTRSGVTCEFAGLSTPQNIEAARAEAISYASYRIIQHRFAESPGESVVTRDSDALMGFLGFDTDNQSTDYSDGSASGLGNHIAQCYLDFGFVDGANEQNGFANNAYLPVNLPLHPELPGNPDIADLNRWQPLALLEFIDQSGNPISNTPDFLGPEWGQVVPFALSQDDLTIYSRDSFDYWVYHDPGGPPGVETDIYKWAFSLVSIWSSQLDQTDEVMIDISPASLGNIQLYPENFEDYPDFYNTFDGGDASIGYATNPVTGSAYVSQFVPRGDYARVLAEFWADGPDSETPPGHWFVILNEVNDHPLLERRLGGSGTELGILEWDVKSYFTLGGAMHDSAITAWGIKGWYDYIRPISSLRAMADLGQSTDETMPSYDPSGVPLLDGYIELVGAGDLLSGAENEHIGKIKFMAWKGPDAITEPLIDQAGVDWILAENWWPYQRPSFVTPPFAGYTSGHSTFSRAAAEVLTALTGDAYFPGGMSTFEIEKDEFLVFEDGPSVNMTLQWATYRDASDQCSLSRIWGGIHPPLDDIPGRLIGIEVGLDSFEFAKTYFDGVAH